MTVTGFEAVEGIEELVLASIRRIALCPYMLE
jgi:hypothetical protein